MAATLGPRPAAVAREMTKLFEETRRASLAELAAHYAEAGPPKGEITIVVGPPSKAADETVDLDGLLMQAMAGQSLRDAVADVAGLTGHSKKAVYARALELRQK